MGVGAAKTSSDLRDEGWIPCVWSVWEGPADPPPPHKRRRLRLSIAASASAPPASNPPAAGPRVTPAAGEAAAGGAGGVGPPHLNASSAEKGVQYRQNLGTGEAGLRRSRMNVGSGGNDLGEGLPAPALCFRPVQSSLELSKRELLLVGTVSDGLQLWDLVNTPLAWSESADAIKGQALAVDYRADGACFAAAGADAHQQGGSMERRLAARGTVRIYDAATMGVAWAPSFGDARPESSLAQLPPLSSLP